MNFDTEYKEHQILSCLRRIVAPAKPPVNIVFLVILRVLTIMFLFLSLTILMLAVLSKPWKVEGWEGHYMEIGLWSICRFDTIPSDINTDLRCYSDFYREYDKIEIWFESWRYLMVFASVMKIMALIYICVELSRRTNYQKKPWVVVSYFTLIAGIASFISMIILYIKFEFEFIEDGYRVSLLEWTEETGDKDDFEEYVGAPYMMAWCAIVGSFITSYFSFYTKCEEELYINSFALNTNRQRIKLQL